MYLAKTNSGRKLIVYKEIRSLEVGLKRDWVNILTRGNSAGYRMRTLVSKAHGIERNQPGLQNHQGLHPWRRHGIQ